MQITRFNEDGDEETEHINVVDQVYVATEDTEIKRYFKIDPF